MKTDPDDDTSMCDACARDVPSGEIQTCEACGSCMCDDCFALHEGACIS